MTKALDMAWPDFDYTPEVARSEDTMWTAQWSLESPAMGGRILAHDARSTIVYAPNCNPYNESEQRVARLLLYSREMVDLLKRAEALLEDIHPTGRTWQEIHALIERVEGK